MDFSLIQPDVHATFDMNSTGVVYVKDSYYGRIYVAYAADEIVDHEHVVDIGTYHNVFVDLAMVYYLLVTVNCDIWFVIHFCSFYYYN